LVSQMVSKTWWDFFDTGSAHQKAFICTRPHKHRENADIQLCPGGNQNPNPGIWSVVHTPHTAQ